jgi:hypothetical protein
MALTSGARFRSRFRRRLNLGGTGRSSSQTSTYPVTIETNAAVAAEIDGRLDQFDEEHIGARNTFRVVLSVRDDKGEDKQG